MEYLVEHPAGMPEQETAMAYLAMTDDTPVLRLVPAPPAAAQDAATAVLREDQAPRVACGGA